MQDVYHQQYVPRPSKYIGTWVGGLGSLGRNGQDPAKKPSPRDCTHGLGPASRLRGRSCRRSPHGLDVPCESAVPRLGFVSEPPHAHVEHWAQDRHKTQKRIREQQQTTVTPCLCLPDHKMAGKARAWIPTTTPSGGGNKRGAVR